MTKTLRILALLLVALPAFAQAPRTYSQPELDQMLAPIALYPDALLSQVLMAATYPIEVVEAARWTRANPGLKGEAAVRALQNEDWDPSVKSLVAFPQILQRMDEQLKWTESLGNAFLAQEPAVMDTVQQLRRRAQAAGNLQSNEQIRVQQQGQTIIVQSPPEVVYVPYYDPLLIYGPWWWPAYHPVVWAPWPGYARAYYPGVSVGFWWGAPISISVQFFFGNFDWHHHHVRVVNVNTYYYRPPLTVNRTVAVAPNRWHHDPAHRRGVAYRAPEVRQRYAGAQVERRETQRDERRNERPAARVQVQPAAIPQAPAAIPQREQRQERRAALPAAQAQPAVQARPEQRDDRRAERQLQQQQREQARAAEHAQRDQQRQRAEATRAQQQQQRHEQRAAMPAAKAPQTPRAERHEQRQERGNAARNDRS